MDSTSQLWFRFIRPGSSVHIVTRHSVNGRSSVPDRDNGGIFFSVRYHVQNRSAAHPVPHFVGTIVSFPGCKLSGGGGEADHSPPPTVEVKNAWG